MTSAPQPGTHSWPPWVWPARTSEHAVGGHGVEHPVVRGVGHAEHEVGARPSTGSAGPATSAYTVAVDVRVIDAAGLDAQAA